MRLSPRQWYLFGFAAFIQALVERLIVVIMPFIIYSETKNISKSGLAFLIEWLPTFILLPIVSKFSDQMSRLYILKLSLVVRTGLCLLSVGFFLYHQWLGLYFVVVMMLLMGAFSFLNTQSYAALESSLSRLMNASDIKKSHTLIQANVHIALILSPIIAAFFTSSNNYVGLFLLVAVFFLFSMLLYHGVFLQEIKSKKNGSKGFFKEITYSLKFIWHTPFLRIMVFFNFLLQSFSGLIMTLLPAITLNDFKGTETLYSLIISISGLMTISLVFLFLKFDFQTSIPTVLLTILLLEIILSFCKNRFMFIVTFGLLSGVVAIFRIHFRTKRSQMIPQTISGSVTGWLVLLGLIGFPFSGALVWLLGEYLASFNILLLLAMCHGFLGLLMSSKLLNFTREELRIMYP
jgi:DHA3 family macrolide efflux protein-like MFS transporter